MGAFHFTLVCSSQDVGSPLESDCPFPEGPRYSGQLFPARRVGLDAARRQIAVKMGSRFIAGIFYRPDGMRTGIIRNGGYGLIPIPKSNFPSGVTYRAVDCLG